MKTLREAAQAVCDRWDTPLWKDVEPTAVFVGELRAAIAKEEAQTVEPVAHLKFWAYQQVSQDGNVNADEGLEVAKAGEIGMDGVAAFPVFTHPAPATEPTQVTCQIYGHVVGACGECNTQEESQTVEPYATVIGILLDHNDQRRICIDSDLPLMMGLFLNPSITTGPCGQCKSSETPCYCSVVGKGSNDLPHVTPWRERPMAEIGYVKQVRYAQLHNMESEIAELRLLFTHPAPVTEPVRPMNCGTSFCSCIECVVEPVKPSAGERERLIGCLRDFDHCEITDMAAAADMLADDAELGKELRRLGEQADVDRENTRIDALVAQQVAVPQGWISRPTYPNENDQWQYSEVKPQSKRNGVEFDVVEVSAAPQPPQGDAK